ncbi:D-glycerate dehydrogenase [Azotosporobacter soli]|uniref:2-hydroxyacid dehydrogenase n=1 Tax=Azotosporobacter soli TaxID=3055040 RepID=UPI0031FEC8F1
MTRPKVYVTLKMPQEAMDRLREQVDIVVNEQDRLLSKEEMLLRLAEADYDGIFCAIGDVIDEAVIEAMGERCRIIANFGVGFNHIDIDAASRRGIWVTNTPDVLTDATADMAWALLLATARRVAEGDRVMRSKQGFKGWGPLYMLGREISGKTLGIAGAGRIGAAMAKRAKGFNMKILYTARQRKEELEAETGAQFVEKDVLLAKADFLSLHMPLSQETRHYIGSRELAQMKKTAILVNTARGAVVDEAALVSALKSGQIWGAGLDVYEEEPLLAAGLSELDNVVLAPHLGSATIETRTAMSMLTVDNLLAALVEKKEPPNLLNPLAATKNKV